MSRGFTKLFILILLGIGFYFAFNFSVDYMVKQRTKKQQSYVAHGVSHVPSKTNGSSDNNNAQTNPNDPSGYTEGKQYQGLSAKVTTQKAVQDFIAQDPGKIQVIEFFNYGCFWCSKLHPMLTEWIDKQGNSGREIAFYRIPVVFNKQWEVLAKAYYVNHLESKSAQDEAFFKAIHQDHINLSDEKQLKAFFVKQGMSEAKFDELYYSFAINREVTRGNELGNTYQVAVSPAIILNTPSGSYFISPQMTGGVQGVINVLDFLVSKESGIKSSSLKVNNLEKSNPDGSKSAIK
jgi:thiol:disulfide interchange protein DsbA